MEISDFKDSGAGDIIIIGNGPSVEIADLERLTEVPTFGCNSITNVFEATSWRPTYYMVIDPIVDDEIIMRAVHDEVITFVSNEIYDRINSSHRFENLIPMELQALKTVNEVLDENPFLRPPPDAEGLDLWPQNGCFYYYETVTFSMAQICTFMGFERISMIGMDLYKPVSSYMLFTDVPDPLKMARKHHTRLQNFRNIIGSSDKPLKIAVNMIAFVIYDYFLKRWINPTQQNYFISSGHDEVKYITDVEQDVHAHEILDYMSHKRKFEIYNATMGGDLEVYERKSLDQILEQ